MPIECRQDFSLLDSMPIVTCSGKRSPKVALEITDKSYCSTKKPLLYGLKLHALAFWRNGSLPFPESFVITPASENDLNVFKQHWSDIENRTFCGDKIYYDTFLLSSTKAIIATIFTTNK
ncbi:MAG: transposase [Chloroflexia bacterium]|nr:transposase [Chloroflexia bacterium]